MYKIILNITNPLVLAVFLVQLLFISLSFASSGPSAEKIVSDLKRKKIPDSAEIEKAVDPGTSATAQIIFIKNKDSCPLVAKVFKDFNSYLYERDRLKKEVAIIQLVNELGKGCGHPLPIITRYQKRIVVEGVGVILLEKAEGHTIAKYLDQLSSLDDNRIKEIFTTIGEQFGALDALILGYDPGFVLMHNDSHGGNFTYDEPSKQLYWIDTAGLAFRQKEESLTSLSFLMKFSSTYLKGSELEKAFSIARDYFTPDKIKELNLFGKDLIDVQSVGSMRPEGLKFLPEVLRNSFFSQFKTITTFAHKQILFVKSLGEGYCRKNPQGKNDYNSLFVHSWSQYIDQLHRIERALGLPETPFINPEIS